MNMLQTQSLIRNVISKRKVVSVYLYTNTNYKLLSDLNYLKLFIIPFSSS